MDRLTSLRTYCAVVEAESFTGAADRLEMARSMVTKHVGALEEHLGVRLLNRTTRRISRTEAGHAYYERCRELLAELDALDASVHELVERPRGLLKVSAPVSFGIRHLGAAVAGFMARHPEVRVDLQMNDRVVDLIEEGFDLAIRVGRLDDSSLVARPLATTRLLLCASPAYLQRHGEPRGPADLAAHRCLSYSYASTRDEWRMNGPGGRSETVRVGWSLRANNGDVLREAALQHQGIIRQPHFLVGEELRAGRLVEVLPAWDCGRLTVNAVYPHRRHLSAKVRAFVEHLAAALPESV
jgi:DNA-binding transcriptional LysR family regulator